MYVAKLCFAKVYKEVIMTNAFNNKFGPDRTAGGLNIVHQSCIRIKLPCHKYY